MDKTNNVTHDLRLEFRSRNNRLWHLVFDTCSSVAEFCRVHQFPQSELGELLNLQLWPYLRDGAPRKSARRLAEIYGGLVEELFPQYLYQGVVPTAGVAEIEGIRFVALAAAKRLSLPPAQENFGIREALDRAIDTLKPREASVIRAYYDLDGQGGQSLTDIAKQMGVSSTRAHQIHAKAMRKLRHPSRSRPLRPLLETS